MCLHALAAATIQSSEQRSPSGKQIAPRSQRLRGLRFRISLLCHPCRRIGLIASPLWPDRLGHARPGRSLSKQVQSTILRPGIKNSLVMNVRKCEGRQNFGLANGPIVDGTGPAIIRPGNQSSRVKRLAWPDTSPSSMGWEFPGGCMCPEEVDTLLFDQ
jgi:hypothetical protein